jgi:dTDP-4-amino-4,6-dideoxygalactose transaminase
MLSARKSIAEHYFNKVDETFTRKFFKIKDSSMFYRFLLTSNKRFDQVRSAMERHGIAIRMGVDTLLHEKYPSSENYNFPNATQAIQTTLSIPIYPSLTPTEQTKIAEAVNSVLR